MKKKSSIVKLSIIGVLIVIGMILSFCTFNVGFSTYNSFASSIRQGLELDGGVYALYEVDSETQDLDVKMEGARDSLYNILVDKGYTGVSVVKEGSDKLRATLSNLEGIDSVLEILGKPVDLKYVLDSTQKEIITSEHIVGAEVSYNEGYVVVLKLNRAGSSILSSNAKADMHITTTEVGGEPTTRTVEIVNGVSYISGLGSQNAAYELANQIMSGSIGVMLSTKEISTVPASVGDNFALLALLAGIIALVLIMIFMAVKYRLLAGVTLLNILIYGVLMLFFMSVFPWLELSLAGIIAFLIGFAILIDANKTVIDKIKKEYHDGKSVVSSTHYGFKKSFRSIIDGNVIVLLAAAVFAFAPVGPLKAFGFVLLAGSIVSVLCSLFITRKLVKYFFAIFDKNPNLLSLERSAEYAGLGADQTASDVQQQIDAELAERLREAKEKENSKPLTLDNKEEL